MPSQDDRKRSRIGVQAYRAVKRVCQYINIHQLKQGQRLPTHQEFASMLGFSNDTLMTAMRELTACGALARRTGVGTILAMPEALPRLVWSIGIATIPAQAYGPGSVFADLAMRLQTEIARMGCRSIIYCHMPTEKLTYGELENFGPLLQDHEDGLLDALISFVRLPSHQWKDLRQADTIVYHTPFDEKAPCGLIVDEVAMATQAARLLMERQCRSIAAIGIGAEEATPTRRFWKPLQKEVAKAGLSPNQLEYLGVPRMVDVSRDSLGVARKLLDRPEDQRPEGLIILDDYIAFGLTEYLAANSEYRPHITVMTHLQRPHAFHLPVVRFQVDLHEMTQRIVADVQRRLLNPAIPEELQYISPVVQTQKAQLIPSMML